jgi:hypothetical protein
VCQPNIAGFAFERITEIDRAIACRLSTASGGGNRCARRRDDLVGGLSKGCSAGLQRFVAGIGKRRGDARRRRDAVPPEDGRGVSERRWVSDGGTASRRRQTAALDARQVSSDGIHL